MANERPLHLVAPVVTLVDTCVLLDILTVNDTWSEWSAAALADARDQGDLVINPLIYAEVSTGFERVEDVDSAIPVADFRREPLPYQAGFLAAKAFVDYRRRGGVKTSPLPDFYIGAHASLNRYRLLTRDTARFRTYYPGIELLAPN